MLFRLTLLSFLISAVPLFSADNKKPLAQKPLAEHLVIIGVDGLSPDGVIKASTPNLDSLMKEGSWSMRARGVMPTTSSPNWASMISGAGPEQHGVTSNDWQTNKFEITPTVVGSGGIFPTIFGLIREQKPKANIACFHDWGDFGRLFERSAANIIEDSDGPTNAVVHAVAYLKEHKPAFTFIHMDHVDHAGHHDGHGTAVYYESVGIADKLIGEVMKGLKEAGIADKTVVIITSDHGGVGKGHGNATIAELEIPWIISGPGIRKDRDLKTAVNTYDTAVTAAYVLGVTPHPAWIGKPIKEAFNSN